MNCISLQTRRCSRYSRGRAFCSGHDLKEELPPETVLATRLRVEQIQEVTRAIRRFPGPVIAAVHGYALGAGCEFALGCDLVVASDDAQFGFPEVSVGLSVTTSPCDRKVRRLSSAVIALGADRGARGLGFLLAGGVPLA